MNVTNTVTGQTVKVDGWHTLLLYIAILCTVMTFGAVLGLYKYASDRTALVHSNCVQVENLKRLQRDSLARGYKTYPRLTYYQTHPAALKEILKDNREDYRKLAPISCP